MIPTDILRETEADLAALANLPGEIRGKVKAGVAELGRLRDAIDVSIVKVTSSAQATLDALQTLAVAGEPLAAPQVVDAPAAGLHAATTQAVPTSD